MRNAFLTLLDKTSGAAGTEGTSFSPDLITGKQYGTDFNNITQSIQSGGNNIIYIMLLIAAFMGAGGLIFAFIKIMGGGGSTVSESKDKLIWTVIAIIGAFAAVGSIAVLHSIGTNLFSSGAAADAATTTGMIMMGLF